MEYTKLIYLPGPLKRQPGLVQTKQADPNPPFPLASTNGILTRGSHCCLRRQQWFLMVQSGKKDQGQDDSSNASGH